MLMKTCILTCVTTLLIASDNQASLRLDEPAVLVKLLYIDPMAIEDLMPSSTWITYQNLSP